MSIAAATIPGATIPSIVAQWVTVTRIPSASTPGPTIARPGRRRGATTAAMTPRSHAAQLRAGPIARSSDRALRIVRGPQGNEPVLGMVRNGLVPGTACSGRRGWAVSVPEAARGSNDRLAATSRASARLFLTGRGLQQEGNALVVMAYSGQLQAHSVRQAAPPLPNAPQAARNTMHSRVWIPAGSRSIAGVRAAPLQTVPAVVRMRRAAVLPALPVVAVVAVVLGLAAAGAGVRPPDFNDRRLTTF